MGGETVTGASAFTGRQVDLLVFVGDYQRQFGYAPSFEEIRMALGFKSKSSINGLVGQLKEGGAVACLPGVHRSLRILLDSDDLDRMKSGQRTNDH